MRKLKVFFLSVMLSMSLPAIAAQKAMIILDGSGSMWAQIDGEPKLKIAQNALSQLLNELPDEMALGFMAYGHREKGNCDDIELLVEPAKGTKKQILEHANKMRFLGMTPLTASVEQAAEYLKFSEEKATVILITDGLETCRRDPCAAAKELADKGIDFTAHVIGFDLTDEQGQQVSCLATQTGGEYFKASNATELADAMTKTVAVVEEVEEEPTKEEPIEEEEIAQASLEADDEVSAGATIPITWQGPANRYDYITVVEKGAPEDAKEANVRVNAKSDQVQLRMPDAIGTYELRYVVNQSGRVLATRDIQLTPVEASLKLLNQAIPGGTLEIEWSGPANQYDYITLVEKGAPENAKGVNVRVNAKSDQVRLKAPKAIGNYELRYVINQSQRVLETLAVKLEEVKVSLQAPEAVQAGKAFEVEWSGPANWEDFIEVVPVGAEATEKPLTETRTSQGSPLFIYAPGTAGEYEVRYKMRDTKEVPIKQSITVE